MSRLICLISTENDCMTLSLQDNLMAKYIGWLKILGVKWNHVNKEKKSKVYPSKLNVSIKHSTNDIVVWRFDHKFI